MDQTQDYDVCIIHFNDVYDIEQQDSEPVGGAARFVTAISEARSQLKDSLTLFSGDCYSPSILSVFLKGKQMIYPINQCKIDAACIGNHQFDDSVENFCNLKSECNFPWILSNIKNYQNHSERIGGAEEYVILERNGRKIGFIGLADEGWSLAVKNVTITQKEYQDYIKCAKRLFKILKQEKNCDLVIAITHMLRTSDEQLAYEVPEIPLILGGHDHDILRKKVNKSLIVKSGSDFNNFHTIKLQFTGRGHASSDVIDLKQQQLFTNQISIVTLPSMVIEIQEQSVSRKLHQPDPLVWEFIEQIKMDIQPMRQQVIGFLNQDLEMRNNIYRISENEFTNFFSDLVRIETQSDIAIINSGQYRLNQYLSKGDPIQQEFILKCFPFVDNIIVKKLLTGQQIYQALENSVSLFPLLQGRFSSVSGLNFQFNALQPPLDRINPVDIIVNGKPIQFQQKYTVALPNYLAKGRDGFNCVEDGPFLMTEEEGRYLGFYLESFFEKGKLLKENQIPDSYQPIVDEMVYVKDQSKWYFRIKLQMDNRMVILMEKPELHLEGIQNDQENLIVKMMEQKGILEENEQLVQLGYQDLSKNLRYLEEHKFCELVTQVIDLTREKRINLFKSQEKNQTQAGDQIPEKKNFSLDVMTKLLKMNIEIDRLQGEYEKKQKEIQEEIKNNQPELKKQFFSQLLYLERKGFNVERENLKALIKSNGDQSLAYLILKRNFKKKHEKHFPHLNSIINQE